jgi:acetyl-CoA carboxylase carboxyl transferase subunit beta
VAESGALIGFLGPVVYRTLHGPPFPEGVQVAENLVDKGIIDDTAGPGPAVRGVHGRDAHRRFARPTERRGHPWVLLPPGCVRLARDRHSAGGPTVLTTRRASSTASNWSRQGMRRSCERGSGAPLVRGTAADRRAGGGGRRRSATAAGRWTIMDP